MTLNSGFKIGTFKEETKNRFLCTVTVDEVDTVCYIPSSCRLSNFIDLTGKQVLLQPIKKKDARTKYSVYAVKYGRGYIPLNMSNSNVVIEKSLKRKMFSFLGQRENVFKEKIIENYKSDLFIQDTNTIIEIKSIISFDKFALFPTVYSERAIHQLEALNDLLQNGYKVCYIFISMYSGVEQIIINKSMDDYYKLFKKCFENGMKVSAFSIGMKNSTLYIKSRLGVQVE